MEQEISGISKFPEKKDNLRRLSTIFETNVQKRSVPFGFVPEFPEILVKWIAPCDMTNERIETLPATELEHLLSKLFVTHVGKMGKCISQKQFPILIQRRIVQNEKKRRIVIERDEDN